VKGKEVPLVQLNAADEEQLHAALAFMERIAATLARHEEVQALAAKLEQVTAEAGQDKEVLEVLGAPMPEQAVA
jgi:hypothetical protein